MKRRVGFVSNSSSSSFVGVVCDEDVSGYGLGLDDARMVGCGKGHIVCDSHQ